MPVEQRGGRPGQLLDQRTVLCAVDHETSHVLSFV